MAHTLMMKGGLGMAYSFDPECLANAGQMNLVFLLFKLSLCNVE